MKAVTAAQDGDRERAERIREFLAPGAAQSWGTVIVGEPHSKSRPRFSNDGRAYRDPADAEAESTTKWRLRRWFRQPPLGGNLALGCVFFRSSMQLIDGDNMLKHICDAGNGILWVDDSQVTAKFAAVELDREHPRTVLVVAPHVSTMLRGTDYVRPCQGCSDPFRPSRSTQKYCRRDCSAGTRGKRAVPS